MCAELNAYGNSAFEVLMPLVGYQVLVLSRPSIDCPSTRVCRAEARSAPRSCALVASLAMHSRRSP